MRNTGFNRGCPLPHPSVTLLHALLLVASAALLLPGCPTVAEQIDHLASQGRYQEVRDILRSSQVSAERELCAAHLGRAGFTWAIPDLVALSQAPTASSRLAAVNALSAFAGREAYTALLKRLGDSSDAVEEAADRILRRWWHESRDVVLEAASDSSSAVRAAAFSLLGRVGDAEALPHLLNALKSDDSPVVRRASARALGQLGLAAGAPALHLASISDTSTEVALEAAKALAALGGVVHNKRRLAMAPTTSPPELQAVATKLSQQLGQAIVQRRLVELVSVPWPAECSDQQQMLKAAAEAGSSTEVLFITMGREENRVTVRLKVVELSTAVVRLEKSVTDYVDETDSIIAESIDAFINNYK